MGGPQVHAAFLPPAMSSPAKGWIIVSSSFSRSRTQFYCHFVGSYPTAHVECVLYEIDGLRRDLADDAVVYRVVYSQEVSSFGVVGYHRDQVVRCFQAYDPLDSQF